MLLSFNKAMYIGKHYRFDNRTTFEHLQFPLLSFRAVETQRMCKNLLEIKIVR